MILVTLCYNLKIVAFLQTLLVRKQIYFKHIHNLAILKTVLQEQPY